MSPSLFRCNVRAVAMRIKPRLLVPSCLQVTFATSSGRLKSTPCLLRQQGASRKSLQLEASHSRNYVLSMKFVPWKALLRSRVAALQLKASGFVAAANHQSATDPGSHHVAVAKAKVKSDLIAEMGTPPRPRCHAMGTQVSALAQVCLHSG